jgi:hypothetical protein
MTQYKPYLIVKRLLILKSGKKVYDQDFQEGVNIIRGKNSSGKSTIIDFIFFALGGDLNKWKPEAKSCDDIYIEVSLSGKVFVFKRDVTDKPKQGMEIFEGTIEKALTSKIYNWLKYPYSATDNKESFYQVIFKELGIPYSKSDNNNSISMHQLLRLMYVDQMTSIDRLFKFDQFDSPNKRNAIGELMIGLSDFSLYEYRVRFQKLESMLDSKIKDINILHEFLGDQIKTIESIDKEIDLKNDHLIKLEIILREVSTSSHEIDANELTLLRKTISELRENLREKIDAKESNIFEIADSQKFIQSLESRLLAIDDTTRVINALSDIGFHYCPACFNEVNQSSKGCVLCGLPSTAKPNDPTFKIRKEIEFQIRESNHLIEIKQNRLANIETVINQTQKNLDNKILNLSQMEKPVKEINQKSRSVLMEIGATNNEIFELNSSKTKFAKLHQLYEIRDQLQKDVNNLRDEIERKEMGLAFELNRKKNVISNLTLDILHEDKDHEETFRDGKKVDFDFGEDRVTIDNRALFSASSMVYLKNAFRLALLEASCTDASYLYPRFLLMDNVEDKGMEPKRSHQFQKEIIKASAKIKVPHQIIFTTSMIDPELEGTDYCIGPFYDDHNKTLKFYKQSFLD